MPLLLTIIVAIVLPVCIAKANANQRRMRIAAMSGAVLEALDGLRFEGIAVADRPDAQAMAEATEVHRQASAKAENFMVVGRGWQ